MGAARWVVVGTALVAAAVALHLLLGPSGGERSVSRPERAEGAATGPEAAETPSGPPQEELDAASRDAMRSFLRQSAQDEE